MSRVTLYSRPGCRLCDEAVRALAEAAPGIEIEVVDIDSQAGLRARYGHDIPVAVEKERELFRHRFDPSCLDRLKSP